MKCHINIGLAIVVVDRIGLLMLYRREGKFLQ